MSADPVPGAPRDLTPAEVQTIRALAEKATPGPWKVRPLEYDDWGWVRAADGQLVASTYFEGRKPDDFHNVTRYDSPEWQVGPVQIAANAAFIAALSPDVVLALCRLADAQPQGRTGQTCGTCRHWLPTNRETDYRAQCNMGVSGSTAEKAAHHPYPITVRVFGCNLHESLPVSSRPATGERT